MDNDALLRRIAQTLKKEIAPNVDGEYAKTQAYMASVVLEKLAGEIGAAANNASRDRAERERLAATLGTVDISDTKVPAIGDFATSLDERTLCALVSQLYEKKSTLGDAVFQELLSLVRQHLRASLDRRLTYSA